LSVISSESAIFSGDSTFNGSVSVSALGGITINGNWTNTSSSNGGALNADSNTDGNGIFSLGSNTVLANTSLLTIIASDFDFQGTNTGNTLDLFWNSLGGTIGIGDVIGTARIDNDELSRIGNFQLTDTDASFRTNSGTILITKAQKTGNSADFRAANISFLDGASAFNQLVFRGENVNFETNVSATGLVVGDQITNLNFLGNSSLTTSSIGSGSGTGPSMTITGANLAMSSGSTLDSGPGSMSLSFSEGMTLGLLSTTSTKSDAISLTAGSGGIRDADLDGSLDISVPDGGLVVNATGGFGTFENPIEFDVGSIDIPTSQDFSSSSVLANRTFSTTFGQSLQTVSTSRTFRASSESFNLVSYLPVFNVSVSPIIAIGNYLPTLRPLVTNVFSQSFSILETTTTTTSFTSTFLTSGSSNTQFGNLLALDALNNSSLGTGLFTQTNSGNGARSEASSLGLQSLVQTATVSRIIRRTTITSTSQFQSFGIGSTQFGGRIPIGTRSLGTVRTIGGGIATCLLSPSGSVRAVNVLSDSNGGVNNQNNFTNVGLNFTPLRQNSNVLTNNRTVSPNLNRNISNPGRTNSPRRSADSSVSGNATNGGSNPSDETPNTNISGNLTVIDARISGGVTPGINSNISNPTTSSSRTNDRNLNNPDQFQGNANAEQRSLDARISGNSTPSIDANISGSSISVGARISGGEATNINANISGNGTSIGARISGGETLGINANISGNTTSSSNLNLGSRTNDRNLNNPDQFQGNANAEQRSLDARISGGEPPGQVRNNSNVNSARTSFSEGASQSNNTNLSVSTANNDISGTSAPSTDSSLGSRTNDRNLNNPDQFQGNANAEQRSLDARISGNETPGQTRNNSSTNGESLDNQIREMRNRLVANTATERESSSTSDVSEPTLQQRMSRLYSRVVGRNRNSDRDSEEDTN